MNLLPASVLSEDECQRIHETSLKVLGTVGVNVQEDTIRSELLRHGAKPGADGARVLLPCELVAEALAKCPREICLRSVRGQDYAIGPKSRHYSSCLVDPFMLDYHEGRRPPKLQDCIEHSRLIDSLDVISLPYKMDVSYSDVPADDAVVLSNYAFMANMSKHYLCGPHNVEEAFHWVKMCEIMAGGPLRENRIVSALVSPISPLTLDRDFLEISKFLAASGMVLVILPCPMSGATSPASLAGTAVTINAEVLAALTVIQTLVPGTPIVYHNVGHAFNMRSSMASLGGPEKILLAVAGADMGRYHGLPCGAAGSSTDATRFDLQNGVESGTQLMLAVNSRANLVTGVGSLGSGNGTSAEQILFDCDLIALASYLSKGIVVDDRRLAMESFCTVGPGGDFLTDRLTVDLLHEGEHFHTGSFERSGSFDAACCMYENLHARARQLIDHYQPTVPAERQADLEKYVRQHAKTRLPKAT